MLSITLSFLLGAGLGLIVGEAWERKRLLSDRTRQFGRGDYRRGL